MLFTCGFDNFPCDSHVSPLVIFTIYILILPYGISFGISKISDFPEVLPFYILLKIISISSTGVSCGI